MFKTAAALAAFLAASAMAAFASDVAAPAVQPAQQNVPLIEPADVRALMASQEHYVLVDVRRPDEFAAGHIEGATLMPLDTLSVNYSKLPRDVKLVVYCRSGHRSAQAVSFLQEHGYSRAVSMSGGYLAWTGKKP
jgi:rhodanese-related sulfurtransferase